jgi:hypothetical protein
VLQKSHLLRRWLWKTSIRGNGQIDFINRPEKVGKAKRTLPSAKQMVFQSKIKLQGFINLAGGLWYKIEYYKLFTIC